MVFLASVLLRQYQDVFIDGKTYRIDLVIMQCSDFK